MRVGANDVAEEEWSAIVGRTHAENGAVGPEDVGHKGVRIRMKPCPLRLASARMFPLGCGRMSALDKIIVGKSGAVTAEQ